MHIKQPLKASKVFPVIKLMSNYTYYVNRMIKWIFGFPNLFLAAKGAAQGALMCGMCVHPSWQLLIFQLFQFKYQCLGSTLV